MREAPLWLSLSASAVRALPFGRYRAANAIGRIPCRPFRAHLPGELGGGGFMCDLRDTISREAFFTGRYEPQETMLFRHLVGTDATVVDVGANWGYFTLLAAALVGPRGRVMALEPHPDLHRRLSTNVQENGYDHVVCRQVAAADAAGALGFTSSPDAANSGLNSPARAGARVDFVAAAATIDGLLDEAGIGVVELIKIDVEGSELGVLRGMARGIAGRRYRHLLLELHPGAFDEPAAAFAEPFQVLRSAGYTGWQVKHSPVVHRLAARERASLADLLEPLQPSAVLGVWPHVLWSAPERAHWIPQR